MASLSDKIVEMGLDNVCIMDGFDECAVGVLERFGMEPIVIYDKAKVIDKIMEISPGCDWVSANEYYEFNQLGGWHGETTPGFIIKLPEEFVDQPAE